ncbi:MAG: ABC transporter permease, partial [Rhodobacteraceae bacterium]|nr:ABC transporter permease [Paracoccaceae bacterium]
VFAFIISFDEVIVALFISSPGTKTLPIELFAQLREQLTPAIVAISSLLIVFSVATLGLAQFVRSRGRGQRGA